MSLAVSMLSPLQSFYACHFATMLALCSNTLFICLFSFNVGLHVSFIARIFTCKSYEHPYRIQLFSTSFTFYPCKLFIYNGLIMIAFVWIIFSHLKADEIATFHGFHIIPFYPRRGGAGYGAYKEAHSLCHTQFTSPITTLACLSPHIITEPMEQLHRAHVRSYGNFVLAVVFMTPYL